MRLLTPKIDLLFCNKTEALALTRCNNIKQAAEALKQYAHTFVITLGPKGSLLFDGHQFIDVIATEEIPIDTLGAGDMYAGAFLYGLTHNYSWQHAGQLANITSSKIVTIYGPRIGPDQAHQLRDSLLNEDVAAA